MKVDREFVKVDPSPTDPETGEKLEPEQRTAVEITTLPVDVTYSDHAVRPGDQKPDGIMRGTIGNDSTAGEVAQDVKTRCELCQHWRRDDYLKHLAAISETREGQAQIERMRGMLLGMRKPDESSDDDLDSDVISTAHGVDSHDLVAVDMAIRNDFGVCASFTESTGQPTVTPFYGGCPLDDARFKVRDRSTDRVASTRYDAIMRLAQGRE